MKLKATNFIHIPFWPGDWSHWPILGWNVSKSCLQKVDFFENYAIVARQSDNVTLSACKIIKKTSGFNLKETIFFRQAVPPSKVQLKYFSSTNNSTTLAPPRPQRLLEKGNHPLSLNLVVSCVKIGSKTKKLQKSVKNDVFLVISEVFRTFLVLGPILAHQTSKFKLSW